MPDTRFEQDIRASQSAASDLFNRSVDIFRTGWERSVEVQKHAVDAAHMQNADFAEMWRRTFRIVPGAEPMFNFTERIVGHFLDAQKEILDSMVQQTTEVAESAKTQGERMVRAVGKMAESAASESGRAEAA